MAMSDAENEYLVARRKGIRAYNQMVAAGRQGHLPYLDDLLLNVDIVTRENLGIIDLPLKKVIGTYSSGRSTSFSQNFMPLLDVHTEFAVKWMAVYNYQMEEGIRDAIKVYEYLNWFYVIEGNKRVSVLKYIDAASVLAEVTRLVPKYDESDENIRQYYEFLEFYRETRINGIWLNAPGAYKALLALMKTVEVPPIEQDSPYRYFYNYFYLPFRSVLYEIGGDALPMSTGDIFLKYFDLYKLHKKMTEEDMRPRLRALCEELRNTIGFEEAELNTSPEDVPEPSLISSIINIVKPKARTRIAFVYSGLIAESNWAKAHEIGRAHIEEVLKDEIQTVAVDNVAEDIGAYKVFKQLIEEGNTVLFATSPAFANMALRTALEFPQAMIYLCSEQHPFSHVHTYFGRIYEPRFLTGLIAGSLTKTGKIGYVGTYPVKGVISGINAFALGVKLVNPRAQVLVSWAYQWDVKKIERNNNIALTAAGADIISHQNTFTGKGYEGEYGLYSLHCEDDCLPDEYIATPVWNWGVFYEMMVRNILAGAKKPVADAKPMQFWWGLDSGIVDIMYARKSVPLETHKLVGIFKNLMKEGSYNPFTGPIYDQYGVERLAAGDVADAQQIISMDWFVGGIVGNIPKIPADMTNTDVSSGLLEM